MQISLLVDIVKGELVIAPLISFITQIETNPSKVKDGVLFVAKNTKDIPLAIQNGAFAILFDKDTVIIDNEIAWIKVDSTKEALLRLIRFYLSSKNLQGYFCNSVSFDMLKLYAYLNKNLLFLTNDIFDDFKLLLNIENNSIIFSTDIKYINTLMPFSKELIVIDN